MPRDHLAVGVEPGLDVMHRRRAVLAERDVVFAAPDQLDRLADGLRKPQRIKRRLVLAAAAESAAEEVLMQCDLGAIGLQKL